MLLKTDRLIIRYMREADLDRYHPLANSEFVLKYLCMYKTDREESLAYIRQMAEKKRDFAIALKDTDEFIGKIHLDEDSLRYGVGSVEPGLLGGPALRPAGIYDRGPPGRSFLPVP